MKLTWDVAGTRLFETGIDRGVLYPLNSNGLYTPGVAWNGLTSVSESPTGADPNPLYADNIKYLTLRSTEEFEGTINAYTYPDEFAVLDGTASPISGMTIGQQRRGVFGLSFRSKIGNDQELDNFGYKIHLLYGLTCSPSQKEYQTINDNPEAIEFSWEFESTPVETIIDGVTYKPTSLIVIDSTKVDQDALAKLENALYGVDSSESGLGDPTLPPPATVYTILKGQ